MEYKVIVSDGEYVNSLEANEFTYTFDNIIEADIFARTIIEKKDDDYKVAILLIEKNED